MKISIENLATCKKLIGIEYAAEEIRNCIDRIADNYRKQAKLPGFRVGKAPKELIVKSLGEAIEDKVKSSLVNDAYKEAVTANRLEVVGTVDYEEIRFARDDRFNFILTVETMPEFELPPYRGLTVELTPQSVSEKEIDRALLNMRKSQRRFEKAERSAARHDYLHLDYRGTCEGKEIAELVPEEKLLGSARQVLVQIGSEHIVPAFAEQLIGAGAGEFHTVRVAFPADYPRKPLAGKSGDYEVTVKEVMIERLPEVDDRFARRMGFETVDLLRQDLASVVADKQRANSSEFVRKRLQQELIAGVTCELPESLVDQQTKENVFHIVEKIRESGSTEAEIERQKEEIYQMAHRVARNEVKWSLIVKSIARAEKIKVSEADLGRILGEQEARLLAAGQSKKEIESPERRKQALGEIEYHLLQESVMELLVRHATVKEPEPSPDVSTSPPGA